MTNEMIALDCIAVRGIKPFVALCAAVLMSSAVAQALPGQGHGSATDRFPSGSIRSEADAENALAAVAVERGEIEARYVAEEQACHPNFFTTSCIQKAKERRRSALSALRPIEIEANTFKRMARVEERDRALAERRERDGRRTQAQGRENQGPVASEPDESTRKVQATLFPAPQGQDASAEKRQAAEDPISAEERAANLAAYERKKRDALERQRKVAQRKAEKEQKRKEGQVEAVTVTPR